MFNAKDYKPYGIHNAEYMAADAVFTTAHYMCAVHQVVEHPGSPMYAFLFNQPEAGDDNKYTDTVGHGCELDHLFAPNNTNNPDLSAQMLKWWTNFATYHDPNGQDTPSAAAPQWPVVDEDNLQVMTIGDKGKETSVVEEWPNLDKCEYWAEIDYGQWMVECNDLYWKKSINPLAQAVQDGGDEDGDEYGDEYGDEDGENEVAVKAGNEARYAD